MRPLPSWEGPGEGRGRRSRRKVDIPHACERTREIMPQICSVVSYQKTRLGTARLCDKFRALERRKSIVHDLAGSIGLRQLELKEKDCLKEKRAQTFFYPDQKLRLIKKKSGASGGVRCYLHVTLIAE